MNTSFIGTHAGVSVPLLIGAPDACRHVERTEAEFVHQHCKVWRGWLKPAHLLPRYRVIQFQAARVQRLPLKSLPSGAVSARWQSAPVDRITDQRVAKVLEVHADLMRAAGIESATE